MFTFPPLGSIIPKSTNKVNTLIDRGTSIRGSLDFEGCLRVEGQIYGPINGEDGSTLIITAGALIEGDIVAENVVVETNYVGNITCKNLTLLPEASVNLPGDFGSAPGLTIIYHTLIVHPGAKLAGNLEVCRSLNWKPWPDGPSRSESEVV